MRYGSIKSQKRFDRAEGASDGGGNAQQRQLQGRGDLKSYEVRDLSNKKRKGPEGLLVLW